MSYASCVDLTQFLSQPNASWRTLREKKNILGLESGFFPLTAYQSRGKGAVNRHFIAQHWKYTLYAFLPPTTDSLLVVPWFFAQKYAPVWTWHIVDRLFNFTFLRFW